MKYENGLETKQLILDKAKELFLKKGFKETSIRAISAHSHLTSGALYKHFKNKEDILNSIIQPHIDEWWELCKNQHNIWEDEQAKIKNKDDMLNLFKKHDEYIFYNFIMPNYEIWDFVFFKSKDTKYENFLNDFCEWEANMTLNLLFKIDPKKNYNNLVSDKELQIIVKSYLEMFFKTWYTNFSDEERVHYYKVIEKIYFDFWKELFTMNL